MNLRALSVAVKLAIFLGALAVTTVMRRIFNSVILGDRRELFSLHDLRYFVVAWAIFTGPYFVGWAAWRIVLKR